MKTFKEFINEAKIKKVPWNPTPDIGWWEDQKTLIMYHGTHIKNIPFIEKSGIDRPDPETGMISMAFEPNTAFGYASMSGIGGEAEFRKAGSKVIATSPKERAVFVAELPMSWIKANYDPKLKGNLSTQKQNLTKKSKYDSFTGHDINYYQLAELRFKKPIPSKYIKGYMIK